MTPSQLDHLRLIDAHLTALLDLAAKRTPGEWHNSDDGLVNNHTCIALCECEQICFKDDAAFIASCAGNAEAGWRSTQRIIKEAIFLESDAPQEMSSILQIILAAWPIELITKHQ